MPGLDLTQLSSNWKKLQEILETEKSSEPQSYGLKRKSVAERLQPANGHKKPKLSNQLYAKAQRSQGMGNSDSTLEGAHNIERRQSSLAKKHDIMPQDYGAINASMEKNSDEANGGLHQTNKIGKYISLDCEMVGTGPPPYLDNVLARASVVNFHGQQIYDSYVLPPPNVDVKDYRTFVSGIKENHLVEGYARPFAEVQKDVADLLDGRILVGHALRNDINVLMLSHPKRDLRDTSRHAKFRIASNGRPPALRNLAKSELGLNIQTGEHSSVEDARAAMMLFKKEKVAIEEENRKRFGLHRKLDTKAANLSHGVHDTAEEVDEEDDDDLDLLEGEEDEGDSEQIAPSVTSFAGKKKRKKKKRTKRK